MQFHVNSIAASTHSSLGLCKSSSSSCVRVANAHLFELFKDYTCLPDMYILEREVEREIERERVCCVCAYIHKRSFWHTRVARARVRDPVDRENTHLRAYIRISNVTDAFSRLFFICIKMYLHTNKNNRNKAVKTKRSSENSTHNKMKYTIYKNTEEKEEEVDDNNNNKVK